MFLLAAVVVAATASVALARSRALKGEKAPHTSYEGAGVAGGVENFWARRRRLIDWSLANSLPPWLTNVEEGSPMGVALVLGQSLKPDGTPAKVLLDRAELAKKLLDDGKVSKVVASGGDPAGVGHTEAFQIASVLRKAGVPAESIIQESQATTTAENVWFSLRWLPKGTGQLFIVTSDFHIARATYIVNETLNFFYQTLEDAYRHDPRWTTESKRYPRLAVRQAVARSSCGEGGHLNRDHDPKADVAYKSLALRALDELKFLGSGEVSNSLYGPPVSPIQYIWPVQINVTEDPQNAANFREALGTAMAVAEALCVCKAPPEGKGKQLKYPLAWPVVPTTGAALDQWEAVIQRCKNGDAAAR